MEQTVSAIVEFLQNNGGQATYAQMYDSLAAQHKLNLRTALKQLKANGQTSQVVAQVEGKPQLVVTLGE